MPHVFEISLVTDYNRIYQISDEFEIDFILVPGIGFTRDGKRLGRGGGFYDKYLEKTLPQTLKIGVAFSLQIIDTMRKENHDVPVDLLITD